MKRAIAGLLVCLSVDMACGDDDYRFFTDAQGRAVQAKIVAYNSVKGTIGLEREDGKRVWVDPGFFSEDDQAYIKEWIAADLVLSESNLGVSLKKQKLGNYGSKKELKEGEKIYFEVVFNNRSSIPVKGVKIEYRYFIKVAGSGQVADKERTVAGKKQDLGVIAPKQRITINTTAVSLEEVYIQKREFAGYTGPGGTSVYNESLVKQTDDQLEGIWIKIYGPPVGGVPSVRDISYPDDLKDKQRW